MLAVAGYASASNKLCPLFVSVFANPYVARHIEMLPEVCTHTYTRNDISEARSLSNSDGTKLVDNRNRDKQAGARLTDGLTGAACRCSYYLSGPGDHWIRCIH